MFEVEWSKNGNFFIPRGVFSYGEISPLFDKEIENFFGLFKSSAQLRKAQVL
jgi:hypothetical protein